MAGVVDDLLVAQQLEAHGGAVGVQRGHQLRGRRGGGGSRQMWGQAEVGAGKRAGRGNAGHTICVKCIPPAAATGIWQSKLPHSGGAELRSTHVEAAAHLHRAVPAALGIHVHQTLRPRLHERSAVLLEGGGKLSILVGRVPIVLELHQLLPRGQLRPRGRHGCGKAAAPAAAVTAAAGGPGDGSGCGAAPVVVARGGWAPCCACGR